MELRSPPWLSSPPQLKALLSRTSLALRTTEPRLQTAPPWNVPAAPLRTVRSLRVTVAIGFNEQDANSGAESSRSTVEPWPLMAISLEITGRPLGPVVTLWTASKV